MARASDLLAEWGTDIDGQRALLRLVADAFVAVGDHEESLKVRTFVVRRFSPRVAFPVTWRAWPGVVCPFTCNRV